MRFKQLVGLALVTFLAALVTFCLLSRVRGKTEFADGVPAVEAVPETGAGAGKKEPKDESATTGTVGPPMVPVFVSTRSGLPLRIVSRRVPDSFYARWFADDEEPLPPGPRPKSIADVKKPLPEGLDEGAVDFELRATEAARKCFAEKGVPKAGMAMVLVERHCSATECMTKGIQMDATTMDPSADALVLECAQRIYGKATPRREPGEAGSYVVPTRFYGDVDQSDVYRGLSMENTQKNWIENWRR